MRLLLFALYPLLLILLACDSGTETTVSRDQETAVTTFYFTRHAEKGDGSDPALLPAGEDRAQNLANRLSGEGITAVYSTVFRRTQSTAAPLARALGVPVQTYSGSARAKQLTSNWLKKHKGEKVFIVGHSNTVPDLVNALIGERRFGDIDEDNYSRLFRVTVDARGKGRVEEMSSSR